MFRKLKMRISFEKLCTITQQLGLQERKERKESESERERDRKGFRMIGLY